MASFPHLLLSVFLIRGLTLPGATEGRTYLFAPDVSGSRIQAPRGPGSGSTRAGAPAQPSSSQPLAVGAEVWSQGGAAWDPRGQVWRGGSRGGLGLEHGDRYEMGVQGGGRLGPHTSHPWGPHPAVQPHQARTTGPFHSLRGCSIPGTPGAARLTPQPPRQSPARGRDRPLVRKQVEVCPV